MCAASDSAMHRARAASVSLTEAHPQAGAANDTRPGPPVAVVSVVVAFRALCLFGCGFLPAGREIALQVASCAWKVAFQYVCIYLHLHPACTDILSHMPA